MPLYPPASPAPYSYDAETGTATCRTCWTSEVNLLPQEAGPWHAGHQGRCTGTPAAAPSAAVMPFRRPTTSAAPPSNGSDGSPTTDNRRPACPQCSTPMHPMTSDGYTFFRCPACGRRSFCSSDDDTELPSYSQKEDGGVVIYHGTGEVDVEATAELAAQDAPEGEGGQQ
ncbi:TFIIB-type zinc ribbon-containing protein [Streptomyces sasae]|uniref:TFIIB-type zinc ribbon-containing protein n=1 Tax=Streptomyces sasae TaxID=1266772 RepID=UPI002930F5ED|nr:zf-TFIIB domain-containing protein [Streptomyces sasae]